MGKISLTLKWQKIVLMTIGILGVSFAAIFIRLCQQEIPEVTIGFSFFIASTRLLITSILLAPTYGSLSKLKISNQGIKYALGAGICLAFHFSTWTSSLNFTSVAASVSLVNTNPLWVAFLSWWFFREKLSPKTIVGIIMAIIASILIAFAGGKSNVVSNPLLGAVLALLGSWFVSGYIILGKLAQEKYLSTRQYVAITYLTAAICLFPLPLIFGINYLSYPSSIYIYLILMAIVSQIIGHTSLNWCLKHFSPTKISLLILLEPIISSLLAWWFFGEIPPVLVIIGATILLLGITISVGIQTD